jgi:hypothetical protein
LEVAFGVGRLMTLFVLVFDSFDFLDFAELPGLVEGCFFRSIEAEHQEEVFASRNPVRLLTFEFQTRG